MSMMIALELTYQGRPDADGWREDRAFHAYLEPEMGTFSFADRVERLAVHLGADVLESESETVIDADADIARPLLEGIADIDPCVPALPSAEGEPSVRITFYH